MRSGLASSPRSAQPAGCRAKAHTPQNLELNSRGMELIRRLDIVDQLGQVDCPTLVSVGELDPVTPVAAAEEIVGALPEGVAQFEVIDGAGHFTWMDAPERYWPMIIDVHRQHQRRRGRRGIARRMKKIGFLSFGHWTPSPHSQTRSASDALLQSIELAVAAEELGADGAYFRVHHFANQLSSPFPLLAAIGARTSRIEIGTGVIDMRYENPLYMAEDAGAADLISGGRLQLGISRGSPEQVIDGLSLLRATSPPRAPTTRPWPASTPGCSSR